MSEIQANFVVEPITAQIVYSTGQINFTPTTNQLTISTGSAPAAADPLNSVQYNENGITSGDSSFRFVGGVVYQPSIQVAGTSTLSTANISHANISNLDYMNANIANVHITGGQNGYVLQTDGTGNLAWYPEATGTLRVNIKAISSADPMVMTVANTTPYINAAKVSISGVLGANANAIVNGSDFYVRLSNNFATSGNVSLFQDANLSITANGFGLTATANTGVATTYTNTGGNGSPGGITGQIQFNDGGSFGGNSGFTFNSFSGNVEVPGNLTVAGDIDGSVLYSNSANYANLANFATSANFANFAGNVTVSNQPNITSVGTLTSLTVSGNISATAYSGALKSLSYGIENISFTSTSSGLKIISVMDGAITYGSVNATGNITLSFIGNGSTSFDSLVSPGQSVTSTFVLPTGSTAYTVSNVQIDGNTQTVKWVNGQSPTGAANTTTAYTFTLIKTSSAPAYTVLGSATRYA